MQRNTKKTTTEKCMFQFKKSNIQDEKRCSNGFCRIAQKIKRFIEQQSLVWSISKKWTS